MDFDLNLLEGIYRHLDKLMEELLEECEDCPDPDSFGIFDQMEYLMGFGLIALQTYITDTAAFLKMKKGKTFCCGPKTKSGHSKIEILNAVANFWKHREEWIFEGGEKRRNAVDKLFGNVGYETNYDYPISGVLSEILSPEDVRFSMLIPVLIEWRNDLIQQNHNNTIDRTS